MEAELPHILVVDDDDRLRDLLQRYLSEHGFRISVATDAADARSRMQTFEFDLIVLDLMMPGENGLEFAESLRQSSQIPILMLTAMAEQDDRITGLEKGADDYLTKPFEPRELLLRIQSILRRIPQVAVGHVEVYLGDCIFRLDRGELTKKGAPVHLTEVEAALLEALSRKAGEVLSREELIGITGAAGSDRAVDVQVTRLRRKIENNPRMPRYLQTVRGRGYILQPD